MVPICVLGALRYAEMVREGRNAAAKYILNVRGARFPERVKVGLRDIGEPSDDFVGRRVKDKMLDLAFYLLRGENKVRSREFMRFEGRTDPSKLVQAHAMPPRPSCSKRLRHDRPATTKTFVLSCVNRAFQMRIPA